MTDHATVGPLRGSTGLPARNGSSGLDGGGRARPATCSKGGLASAHNDLDPSRGPGRSRRGPAEQQVSARFIGLSGSVEDVRPAAPKPDGRQTAAAGALLVGPSVRLSVRPAQARAGVGEEAGAGQTVVGLNGTVPIGPSRLTVGRPDLAEACEQFCFMALGRPLGAN